MESSQHGSSFNPEAAEPFSPGVPLAVRRSATVPRSPAMANTVRRLLGVLVCSLSLGAAGLADPAAAAAQTAPGGAATPAPAAAAPAAVPECAPSELGLREIAVKPDHGDPTEATYVLQNRGSVSCRIVGSVGIRLLDPQGNSVPLRFAVRNAMAMLLTLAPGGEASFTVSYVAPVPARCAAADRIAVFVPPQTTAVTAPATIAACTGGQVRVSNLSMSAPRFLP
jgi:Domain of unknown function (DUF4232)